VDHRIEPIGPVPRGTPPVPALRRRRDDERDKPDQRRRDGAPKRPPEPEPEPGEGHIDVRA
jgi:hypothetical protein